MMKRNYIYLAIVLYMIAAYCSMGQNSPDEYYQILQFAAYKLGKAPSSSLSWEFTQHARPALQVWLAVMVYNFCAMLASANPFVVAMILRLFSAIISLLSALLFIHAFLPSIKHSRARHWFILLSLFSWLILYNSVRFSAENLSAKFFLLAFAMLFLPKLNRRIIFQLLIGFSFGLAVVLRLQMILAVGAILLWLTIVNNFIHVDNTNARVVTWRIYPYLIFAFIAANLVGVVIDHWFYGQWVWSNFQYLYANLVQGKAASFGSEPWYFYAAIAAFVPYGLIYLCATFVAIRYKIYNPVVWVIVIFIAGHMLIAHKELRFLVPILGFMPLLIAYTIDIAIDNNKFTGKVSRRIWRYSWYFNCFAVILVAFLPSGTNVLLCKTIYDRYTQQVDFYTTSTGGNIVDFYKRDNLQVHYLKDIKEISTIKCPTGSECLVAFTCGELKQYQTTQKGEIIYDNCPNWVDYINVNDWVSRSGLFRIYSHSL